MVIKFTECSDKDLEQLFADTTRKIAALRSNEALMVRRYKAVEDSEMRAKRECVKLREEIVNVENAVIEKIGELQRHVKFFIYQNQCIISFFIIPILKRVSHKKYCAQWIHRHANVGRNKYENAPSKTPSKTSASQILTRGCYE